eukprot:3140685-Pleurochrysis_carterae.AAC.2
MESLAAALAEGVRVVAKPVALSSALFLLRVDSFRVLVAALVGSISIVGLASATTSRATATPTPTPRPRPLPAPPLAPHAAAGAACSVGGSASAAGCSSSTGCSSSLSSSI